jgi:hypothetical protein
VELTISDELEHMVGKEHFFFIKARNMLEEAWERTKRRGRKVEHGSGERPD